MRACWLCALGILTVTSCADPSRPTTVDASLSIDDAVIASAGVLPSLPGGVRAQVRDVAGAGIFAGEGVDAAGVPRAIRWVDNRAQNIPMATPTTQSDAWGVDTRGNVVGYYLTPAREMRPFIFQAGVTADLPLLAGGRTAAATFILDPTRVVGYGGDAAQETHAVLWRNGLARDLGTLPGDIESAAHGVNTLGVVVGYSKSPLITYRAVKWVGGVLSPLALLPGWYNTIATAINQNGEIVGYGADPARVTHPVVWRNGVMIDLGLPSGADLGTATDVTGTGEIVGYVHYPQPTPNGLYRAVAWVNGTMRFLGEPVGANWSLATRISEKRVVGGVAGADAFDQAVWWKLVP